jgi:hypothetical protein
MRSIGMARLEFEVRKISRSNGVYMGSLEYPATIDVRDMIGFFRPDPEDPERGYIALEPRRERERESGGRRRPR